MTLGESDTTDEKDASYMPGSPGSDVRNNEVTNSTRRINKIAFLLTNARSLGPKISSLIDYLNEMSLTFAMISETWLVSGRSWKKI